MHTAHGVMYPFSGEGFRRFVQIFFTFYDNNSFFLIFSVMATVAVFLTIDLRKQIWWLFKLWIKAIDSVIKVYWDTILL